MSQQVKARTVRFFEIVDTRTGDPLADDLDWRPTLEALGRADVTTGERTLSIGGEDHHGGPWLMSGLPPMLLFSKIRDDFELPDVFDRRDGSLEAIQIAEQQGIAETTHVGFFPLNIVAMIRTNTTPGAGNLERWINNMHLFDELRPIEVQPLSRVDATRRIQDVEQARGVKIRMRTTAAASIADRAPRLADTVQHLQEQFGPVMVEMRIYIPQDQGYTTESDTILEEARGLFALTAEGRAVDGLQAAQLFYRSRERERADDINMLKDKLAEEVFVEVLDGEGKSTRRESAARAMDLAYAHLKDDLIAAIGRDRG